MNDINRRVKEIENRLELADEFKDNWEQLVLNDVPWLLRELKHVTEAPITCLALQACEYCLACDGIPKNHADYCPARNR